MTWRETYDTVLKYFRSKGDKEAEAKARSKPMQYYEDNFADEIIEELATKYHLTLSHNFDKIKAV